MKKQLLFLITAMLALLLVACGSKRSSEPVSGEQAPAESVTTDEAALPSDDAPEDESEDESEPITNNPVKIERILVYGKYLSEEIEYDASGKIIKRTTFTVRDNKSTIDTWVDYEYDENGLLIKTVTYDENKPSMTTENEYDSNGYPLKQYIYWPNGSIAGRFEYVTDADGNIIREYYYTLDSDKVNHWSAYEYDANGNQTKAIYYIDAGDYIESYSEYEYDSEGKLLTENHYDHDGIMFSKNEYEYDGSGHVIKETDYKSDGEVHYWYTHEYEFFE